MRIATGRVVDGKVIVDGEPLKEGATVTVLTPDNEHLCIAATVEGYVGILSVPDLELLATIPVGEEPSWIITSLDGRYCYASARIGNTVSIISIEDKREIKRIPVGDYPQRMWTARVPIRRVSRD